MLSVVSKAALDNTFQTENNIQYKLLSKQIQQGDSISTENAILQSRIVPLKMVPWTDVFSSSQTIPQYNTYIAFAMLSELWTAEIWKQNKEATNFMYWSTWWLMHCKTHLHCVLGRMTKLKGGISPIMHLNFYFVPVISLVYFPRYCRLFIWSLVHQH